MCGNSGETENEEVSKHLKSMGDSRKSAKPDAFCKNTGAKLLAPMGADFWAPIEWRLRLAAHFLLVWRLAPSPVKTAVRPAQRRHFGARGHLCPPLGKFK